MYTLIILYSGVEYILTAVSTGDLHTVPDVQGPQDDRTGPTEQVTAEYLQCDPHRHFANMRK